METPRGSQRRILGEEHERICPRQVQPDHHHRREGKLSQSEIDRMVHEADNYRDDDEDDESKIELRIAGGVNAGKDDLDVGAGEQDIKFEYASDETYSMTIRLGRN